MKASAGGKGFYKTFWISPRKRCCATISVVRIREKYKKLPVVATKPGDTDNVQLLNMIRD